MSTPEKAEAREAADGHASSEPRARVLLIDDNPVVLAATAADLEDAGYDVVTADTGEAGLKLAAERRPDAAIVDFELPGIDGMAVIHRFATDPVLDHIPSILLTGAEQAPAELEGLEAGADAYVRKGTGSPVLLARLKALLRERWRSPMRHLDRAAERPCSVLVVSDDTSRLERLARALEEEQHDIHHATVELAPGALCPDGAVDCVLLDLEAGSADAIARLRASHSGGDVPLIAVAQHAAARDLVEVIEGGADDCVSLDDDLEVVLGRVRAQLRRKRVEDASRERYEQRLEAEQARAARELADTRAQLLEELEQKNAELEQKNAELAETLRELRARDRQFRTVARCVPGVVYLCENDAHRSMLFMSVAIEPLLGYRAMDFTEGRHSWSDLVHPEDRTRVVARIDSALSQRNAFSVEYRLRGSDALYRWVEERGRAIFDDEEEVRCVGGTIFDITERKEAEEELERFRTRTWRRRKKGADPDADEGEDEG